MNKINFIIPNNKEITIFLEKFAQNSMNLSEDKINLLKNSLDLKYQNILNEFLPYLNYRIEFYKKNNSKQSIDQHHYSNSLQTPQTHIQDNSGYKFHFEQEQIKTELKKKRRSKFDIESNNDDEDRFNENNKLIIKLEDKYIENFPVGQMASIIKNMRTICNKDDSPYLPIINDFSKELIIEKINDRINEKIKSFYDFYSNLNSKREIKETLNKEIKRQENNKRESKKSSPSSSENSNKSDDFKNQKHKKKLRSKYKKLDINNDHSFMEIKNETKNKKSNNNENNCDFKEEKYFPNFKKVDIFENFRNNRSHSYHITSGERNTKEENQLCYKCFGPGHFAKDCKYGLN